MLADASTFSTFCSGRRRVRIFRVRKTFDGRKVLGRSHPGILLKLERKILVRRISEDICDFRIIVAVFPNQLLCHSDLQVAEILNHTAVQLVVKQLLQLRAADRVFLADLSQCQRSINVPLHTVDGLMKEFVTVLPDCGMQERLFWRGGG